MNQSQQLAHLMNNYTSTNEQQVLQQYLASANTFPHSAHSLAALPTLHSMAGLGGSTASASSLLNNLHNFSAFHSLALAMAAQTNPTSSPLSSTNSSASNPAALNSGAPMFAALLQAQQRLNGLSATSLLQKYDQTNNNSQQSPGSVASSCSSPPTCSSVTPPTPPPSTTATSLQLLAQHYNHLQSTMNSSTSSTITLSNSLNNVQSVAANTTTSPANMPSSLSSAAAAAVLSGQPNLNLSSLVAANSHLSSLDAASKRLAASPDTDASNELVDIQQYYSQLNALRQQLLLSSTAGLTSSFNPAANSASLLTKPTTNPLNQQPIKDLAKLYTAINCNTVTDLNSPLSSSLSNSSSSTNSLQNSMTSLQQQQMMAAMASTGSFAHNAHMHLLSPNSIKSLKFSIENILSPSFGNTPAELAAAINQQTQTANLTNSLSSSLTAASPMSKLLEFNKQAKNGLTPTSNGTASSNKLTNFLNSNNATTKQQISSKLEQVNSNINGLSSIINNLNPGLSTLDFKLNTSKRKKRSSMSMDDACENEPIRNVKRKNSIDSDCSNSNSSIGATKLNSTNNSSTNGNDKSSVDKVDLKSSDSSNDKSSSKLPSPEEVLAGQQPIPAWVFCTRYSDRPSSGKWFALFVLFGLKKRLVSRLLYRALDPDTNVCFRKNAWITKCRTALPVNNQRMCTNSNKMTRQKFFLLSDEFQASLLQKFHHSFEFLSDF